MRHWLLIFMIVLLPMRAWAGVGMAMQTMEHQQIAPETVANYSINTGTSGAFHAQNSAKAPLQTQPDCHGHTAADVDHTNATVKSAGNLVDCASICGVCQVCHSVALASEWPVYINSAPSSISVGPALQIFTSAERALSLKPPIS